MKKTSVAGDPTKAAGGQPRRKRATSTGTVVKEQSNGVVQAKRSTTGTVPAKRTAGAVTSHDWQPRLRARFVTEVAGGTRRAADLLDVAASQPSRWATGESVPGPGQARMLLDIDHVLAHALLVWADAAVARDWLTTANVRLDGASPLDWIRMHGTADVVEALRAEAAGAYT